MSLHPETISINNVENSMINSPNTSIPSWAALAYEFFPALNQPKQNFAWFSNDELLSNLTQALFITHKQAEFKLGMIVVDGLSEALELNEALQFILSKSFNSTAQINCHIISPQQDLPTMSTVESNLLIIPSCQLNRILEELNGEKGGIAYFQNLQLDFFAINNFESMLKEDHKLKIKRNPYLDRIARLFNHQIPIFIRFNNKRREILQAASRYFNKLIFMHPVLSEHSSPSKKPNVALPTFPNEPCVVLSTQVQKRNIIQHLLINFDWQKVIIITKTKHAAHRIEEKLFRRKIRSKILHTALPEEIQMHFLQKLINQEIRVLFITDDSFKTLDLPALDTVFFYDACEDENEFLSRIRFFQEKQSNAKNISLITEEERPWLDQLEDNHHTTFPKVEVALPQAASQAQKDKSDVQTKKVKTADKVTNENHSNNTQKTIKTIHKNKIRKNNDGEQNRTKSNARKNARKKQISKNKNTINNTNTVNFNSDNEQQGIVNQNRLPFEQDSFEANISRENKRRVRNLFSNKNSKKNMEPFEPTINSINPNRNDVKIVHRKKKTIDPDDNIGNQ